MLESRARVDVCADFVDARARLLARPPHLLVTSIRLGAYNGLHLAYLAVALSLPTRVIVHSETMDVGLAREAQLAHAFYAPAAQLAVALPAYLEAELPPQDRRNVACPDRRQQFRSGRRVTDIQLAS